MSELISKTKFYARDGVRRFLGGSPAGLRVLEFLKKMRGARAAEDDRYSRLLTAIENACKSIVDLEELLIDNSRSIGELKAELRKNAAATTALEDRISALESRLTREESP